MALAAQRALTFVGSTRKIGVLAAQSKTYYRGAILGCNAAGYADIPSDLADQLIQGIFTGNAEGGISDYAYAPGANYKRLELERGLVWIPMTSAAQTDIGQPCYPAADDNMTLTKGSNRTIGYYIIDVDVTNALVLIDLDAPVKV